MGTYGKLETRPGSNRKQTKRPKPERARLVGLVRSNEVKWTEELARFQITQCEAFRDCKVDVPVVVVEDGCLETSRCSSTSFRK